MRALVTGAAGFVGSTLSDKLLEDPQNSVIGIDSFADYYDVGLKRLNIVSASQNDRYELVEGDILEQPLEALLGDVDVVFHQAGQPGVRKSWGSDFGVYARSNIEVTQALLEAAKAVGTLKRFVYASSSSVYGDAERYPTTELDRPQPRSPYGVTKLAAEHLCSLYAKNFGVPTVSLRYFTVYGPRQRPDMAFNIFISKMLRDGEISVFGDGEQIREFTHVQDIVRANVLASQADVETGTVVNLSGGASVTVNEVFALLEEIHGSAPRVNYGSPVPGDVRRTGGSTARASELLGWAPAVDLRDGLESEYRWMRELNLSRRLDASFEQLAK
ncbi:NAD-dependent epimerase/dehydratase family protein [Plantibacter sp. Mn2098]|uniref:NAD-dependent epimerase/dehydratase family protein n=1 Tax=Plantibacter sp. Mn2098 TaxID=3395266 RepID=UPI003BDE3876